MPDGDAWDHACVDHLLTSAEREQFEQDGFIIVRDALSPATVDTLGAVARRADASFRSEPGVGPHHVMNQHDLVGRDDAYLELVDVPTTFPKVWGLLGWHIQVFHTQLLVTPPAPPGARPGACGWHQDNNRMNLDLDVTLQPRISLKVGYFLSDLPCTGMGNLCVVPGSQRGSRPAIEIGDQPDGAREVTARAGDAIVFDRRLWHAASTNVSDTTRIFVTVGYSHRWLRPKSRMDVDLEGGELSAIRRQLLGATTSANAWFEPTDDDVPLREWIRTHVGDAHVAP